MHASLSLINPESQNKKQRYVEEPESELNLGGKIFPVSDGFRLPLEIQIEEHSKQLIDKLNAKLAKAKTKSGNSNGNIKRVGFGVYYVEDDITTDE